MSIIDFIGISGCVLASIYYAVSFPTTVKLANGEEYPRQQSIIHFGLCVFMYSCLGTYACLKNDYILAFAQILGLMKYSAVLIQLALNKTRR